MKKSFLIIVISLLFAGFAFAGNVEVTLSWDPSPSASLYPNIKYRLYASQAKNTDSASQYKAIYTSKPIYEGTATTCKVTVPDDKESAFVATAFITTNISGEIIESGYSNEVVHRPKIVADTPRNLIIQKIGELIQGMIELKDLIASL